MTAPTSNSRRIVPRPDLSDARLAEATGWRYAYLTVQAGLSLGLYVGLAAVLPGPAFAVCAVALGALVVVQAAADFGFSQAAVAALPNPATLGPILPRAVLESGVARLVTGGAAVALGLSCAVALMVPAQARGALIAIGPASALAVVMAGVDGILRAGGRFRRPVLLTGLSRLGALPAIGVAAATKDAQLTCIAISAGILAGSLPAIRELRRRWLGADGRAAVRPLLRAGAPLGLSNLFILAGARANTLVLGGIASISSAAVFESAWRVFQAGQYVLGAAATAVGPFVAAALSEGRRSALHARLRRTASVVTCGGAAIAAAIVLLRHPLADAVSGGDSEPVVASLVILAPVLPASLLLLFATVSLSAVSSHERAWIFTAYGAGALVNLVAVIVLADGSPSTAGAWASAAGVCVSLVVLGPRFALLFRDLRHR